MNGTLDGLRGAVHPDILERAESISARLTALAVPHALIGGLAVGMHGHPRATKDLDFLVGDQAFATTSPFLVFRPELAEVARVGFSDFVAIPPGLPWLEEELAASEGVPVISLPGLILLKLVAFRAQDRADIAALLQGDDARLAEVNDYLAARAPDMLIRLGETLSPQP
jgi:hypothetical protein